MSTGETFNYNVGVPQGGPLSMRLFCLALQPCINMAAKQLNQHEGTVIAYADDVFILAPPECAFNVFETLALDAHEIGLQVRRNKCQILATDPNTLDNAAPLAAKHLLPTPKSAISVLGTPVGDPAAERQMASQNDTRLTFSRLDEIDDLQCRLLMLRYCIASKFTHFARTLPPDSATAGTE
jgi:hypothetical protein